MHFGSYLSQMLMDFASIWVILKPIIRFWTWPNDRITAVKDRSLTGHRNLTGQADRANPAFFPLFSCPRRRWSYVQLSIFRQNDKVVESVRAGQEGGGLQYSPRRWNQAGPELHHDCSGKSCFSNIFCGELSLLWQRFVMQIVFMIFLSPYSIRWRSVTSSWCTLPTVL